MKKEYRLQVKISENEISFFGVKEDVNEVLS